MTHIHAFQKHAKTNKQTNKMLSSQSRKPETLDGIQLQLLEVRHDEVYVFFFRLSCRVGGDDVWFCVHVFLHCALATSAAFHRLFVLLPCRVHCFKCTTINQLFLDGISSVLRAVRVCKHDGTFVVFSHFIDLHQVT